MTMDYYERRKVRIGDFEYLLDDEDKTAWISEGHSGGERVYTLPDKVDIEGTVYTITSVEIDAYNTPQDTRLEELFFPDSYEYFDEYAFCHSPLKKVHLGKGFRYYMYWTLRSAADDVKVEIAPANPFIKMSEDGHMVLSKDGKELIYLVHDLDEVTVPEGFESILGCAISCKRKLKRVHLPSTLRRIATDGISMNRALENLVIPEGVLEIGHQAFGGDSGMDWVDLPSTVKELDSDTFMDDTMLSTLILRSPGVVEVHKMRHSWHEDFPLETCRLIVPGDLIPDYRNHPVWGSFRHIEPLPAAKRNAP